MSDRLVTIAVFGQMSDAHLARGALEAAGIRVALQNEETNALFGPMSSPLGGVRLVVRAEDEPAAVKVLEETFGPNDPISEEELGALAVAAAPNAAAAEAAETVSDPVLDALQYEKDARTAATAACLGLFVPFASLFALVLILGVWPKRRELSETGQSNLHIALALVFWPFVLGFVVLALYLS